MKSIDKLLNVAKNEIGYLEKRSNSQLDSKTANAVTESTITFPRAFNSAPKVVVSFYSDTKLAKYGMMTPMVSVPSTEKDASLMTDDESPCHSLIFTNILELPIGVLPLM